MNVAPMSVVVRYGDSNEYDFCVMLDPAVPLGEALDAELRRAMSNKRLPVDFAIDDYRIECWGAPVDRDKSLRDIIAAEEPIESSLLLVLRDSHSPIRIVTFCKHDGGVLRAQLDVDPSQSLESAISGSFGELSKTRFNGRVAGSWRYRRSLAPPKGYRRGLSGTRTLSEQGVRSNEMIELKPGLKTVWHPKRPRTIVAQVMLLSLVAYLIWVATANQVDITIVTGNMPAIVELMGRDGNVIESQELWPGESLNRIVKRSRYTITARNPVYPIIEHDIKTPSRWRPWAKVKKELHFPTDTTSEPLHVKLEAQERTREIVSAAIIFPEGEWIVNGIDLSEKWMEWLSDKHYYNPVHNHLVLEPGVYEFSFRKTDTGAVRQPSILSVQNMAVSRIAIRRSNSELTGVVQLRFLD